VAAASPIVICPVYWARMSPPRRFPYRAVPPALGLAMTLGVLALTACSSSSNDQTIEFGHMSMYDNQGNSVTIPTLPQIGGFDVVGASRVYSRNDGNIYNVTTGAVETTGAIGTAAGSYVLSVTNRSLVATSY